MTSRLNPYISFRNTARDAMTFYQSVFGGKLDINTFAEFHAARDPAENDLIMHAILTAPNGFVLMGADTPLSMELDPGNHITISLSGDDDGELRAFWGKLAEGGQVTMPLEKAPWGDSFGQLTDKFGIAWMVNITGAPQP